MIWFIFVHLKELSFKNLFQAPTSWKFLNNFTPKFVPATTVKSKSDLKLRNYLYNILEFLLSKELPTFVLNPLLQTNQFRSSLFVKPKLTKLIKKTLRIFLPQISTLRPTAAFQNKELNSLTYYRFEKVQGVPISNSLSQGLSTPYFPNLKALFQPCI